MRLSQLQTQMLVDVLIYIFFMVVPLMAVFMWGEPLSNGFWCNDLSLSYQYKPDTISQNVLLLVGFGAPLFVMALTEVLRAAFCSKIPRRFQKEMFSLAKAYGVFLFGVAANCIFTETIKYSVGRLRPHFFDLCKPDFHKINCTDSSERFVSDFECTNQDVDHHLLRDSRLSFPSGHASVSMYSALFTVFYLEMRMQVSFSYLLRPVLQMFLVVIAMVCCMTRITDHKHFLTDVLAGSFLGITVAWLSFYKIGHKAIPNVEPERRTVDSIRRATSIESEPQTPTPLLRPERLVLHNDALIQQTDFRHDASHNGVKEQLGVA